MRSSFYFYMCSYTKNKSIKTYNKFSCQTIRSIINISQSISNRYEITNTYRYNLYSSSFIHTDKIEDNITCMCGLIKCSANCPAKYYDNYEILDEKDNLAPYLGSNWDVIDDIFDLVNITNKSKVLDIGCGDGRVLIRASQRNALYAHGYELNKSVYDMATVHCQSFDNIKLFFGDCRKISSLENYNIITLFLLPNGLEMLEPFLNQLLSDNNNNKNNNDICQVISLGWPIPSWKEKIKKISKYGTAIYLYDKFHVKI